MLLLVVTGTLPYAISQPTYPATEALQAFEAIREAENAGADVSSLVSEYRSLLQSSADSFGPFQAKATEAREAALESSHIWSLLTIVIVPLAAFLLATGLQVVLHVRKRLARKRMQDQEVSMA